MNEQVLPSTARLLRSTVIALVAAIAILVAIVLPAEYAIDPLHTGQLLGLTDMARAKGVGGENGAAAVMYDHPRKFFSGRVDIKLKGREGLEYKAVLPAGEPLIYSWTVQGGEVYSEFHGEPTKKEDWPKDYYRSYRISERTGHEHGSFVAPFTGQHGWYWRNLSDEPVTVSLEAHGYYSRLARVE